jgi:hypothetical protein
MQWFRRSVVALAFRSPGFDSRRPVRVIFVVDKLVLGQAFLIFVYVLLWPGQTGEDWKPSKNNAVSEIGDHWI